MEFGVSFFPTDEGMDPVELARIAEDKGFESIFCPDHTHIPASRETPFPMPPYGDLPRQYYRLRDPLVHLACVAMVTKSIKLGTGICLIVERDPILFAKQAATVDLVSGGRLVLGVGAGWNREEMRNHGVDPRTRMQLMVERVEAIKAIWTSETAEYHGELVDFDPIYSWPKPVQKPHPPVLIGGNGPTVLERVVRCGDGWFPGHQKDLAELAGRIAELQQRAEAAGRPPIPVTLQGARPAFFERYFEMGIARCVIPLAVGSAAETLESLAAAEQSVLAFKGG